MELDIKLFIEQANSYLLNILNINLLLFTASALIFGLSYKRIKSCCRVLCGLEIFCGVINITIIMVAQRNLLDYIANRPTAYEVDLVSPLSYLSIVYWVDLLWLLFISIRAYKLRIKT